MKNLIIKKLIEAGYDEQFAKIVAAQACHESNYFTSDLFRRSSNCFGMRVAVVRPYVRAGVTNNYSAYTSVSQCVQDYILYLKDRKIVTGSQRYLSIIAAASRSLEDGVKYYAKLLKEFAYYEDINGNYERGMLNALKFVIA